MFVKKTTKITKFSPRIFHMSAIYNEREVLKLLIMNSWMLSILPAFEI